MKTILYTLSIMLCSLYSHAQYYDFVSFNRDYYESDDWTSVSNGEVWDDPAYEISLPFDFEFYGETINTIYIMGDGYGTQLGTKPDFYAGPVSILLPYDLDVIDRGYNDNQSLSEIRYTTETTADNELFIIEWYNVGFYDEIGDGATSESYISFQVIFNKNFNAIELSFGESNIDDPLVIYDGAGGASVCLAQNLDEDPTTPVGDALCLFGDADNPDIMSLDPEEEDQLYLVGDIPENKSYLFSVNDAVSNKNYIQPDQLMIYPSPATNHLQIISDIDFTDGKVISLEGIYIKSVVLDNGNVDISNLRNGMYFLELKTKDGNKIVKPFIKGK